MPIAVTEDHQSLRAAALRWSQTHCPPSVPRQVAEATGSPGSPGSEELPAAWEKMAAQGWLGLHLPEEEGGQGFTVRGPTGVTHVAGVEITSGTGIQGDVASFTVDQHAITPEISAADADAANREIRKLRDVDSLVRAPA